MSATDREVFGRRKRFWADPWSMDFSKFAAYCDLLTKNGFDWWAPAYNPED